jgi:excisionase family DNA binding protein
MADPLPDTVTIGEAAELLGVHRNTVRNRIKAGHYKAHKVVTPQGETYAIERDSLDIDPTNDPHNPSHTNVHHNAPNPSQGSAIVDEGQQAQQLAVVQRLLAPFIEELGATKLELGRTQERLSVTEQERDELRAQVELLEEIQRVRERDETPAEHAAVTLQNGPGREEAFQGLDSREHPQSHVAAWLRRLLGRSS